MAGSLLVSGSDGTNGDAFWHVALGYALFAASDTCILMQLAGHVFEHQETFILVGYFISQLLLYSNALSATTIKL